MSIGTHGVITIWMTYLFAAAAASGIFVVAGWRSKPTKGLAATRNWQGLPRDPLWGDDDAHITALDGQADVGSAIRLVLKRLSPVMASHSVKADIACPASLLVRMKTTVLVEILEELLAATIHNAPASQLLLTATTHGDRIHVGITDDMPGASPAVRQGALRGLIERIAMRGASLDIAVRPAEGTTVTLRLAAVTDRDRPALAPEMELSGVSGGFAMRTDR